MIIANVYLLMCAVKNRDTTLPAQSGIPVYLKFCPTLPAFVSPTEIKNFLLFQAFPAFS